MKPILFSTPMVQAILAGRKTMTRRVIKSKWFTQWSDVGFSDEYIKDPENCVLDLAPYRPGDILWVRETCWKGYDEKYHYKTDYVCGTTQTCKDIKILPSIHMPREAARIFLRVTNVRVERVQDITPYDAWLEGCRLGNSFPWEEHIPELQQQCRDIVFRDLWDSINAKRGYGWETNPWVFVYEFERVEQGK